MQRAAAVLLISLGFGPLAWTLFWRLAEGRAVGPALLAPWEAAAAFMVEADVTPPALAGSGLAAVALTVLVLAAVLARRPPAPFGDARFATAREVRAQGLASTTGLLLGTTGGLWPRYLRHGGAHHLLLAAPTRSGKGVGVVTPNLLSWPGSVVVLDVKNENFEATSGFRASSGQAVFRFAPGDPGLATHRFNPLDAVRRAPEHRIADLQAVALLLAPDGLGDQKMWHEEARALFVGLSLYILDTPGLELTLGEVLRLLQADADLGEALLAEIKVRGAALDPACANMLSNFAHKAVKERSGVKSTLTGALALFNDPAIAAATGASDFDLGELRRRPTSIYVSVALDQLDRTSPLLALFFQQLVGVLSRALPGGDEPWPVLIVLDEFAALGRMSSIADRMPFLAGFNVRLLLVIQGLAQLDRVYGTATRELILQNAGLQAFFAANDEQTSAYISNRAGQRTVVRKTRSRSMRPWGGVSGVTHGEAIHARPLLTADEVRRLAADEAILFVEGGRPVRARKIVHYRDRRFIARLRPPIGVAPIEVVRRSPFVFTRNMAEATAPPSPAPALSVVSAPARRRPRTPRPRPLPSLDQLDFDRLLRGPGTPGAPS